MKRAATLRERDRQGLVSGVRVRCVSAQSKRWFVTRKPEPVFDYRSTSSPFLGSSYARWTSIFRE